MSSIIESLGDLVNAVFHTITALIGSVVAVLRSFVDAILGVFQGFFHLIGSTLSGLVHTFEGLSKFVLIVVGALLTGAFLYSVYQKRNGRPVTAAPAKKTS
ncbi:hypothetical protein CJF30_00000139 [Rutstroemia sp. NJR-2017a BBW]|nr:hypothetical protein CJF30_00000139 [Rutstroemia sp. NJR-2017a BBW]